MIYEIGKHRLQHGNILHGVEKLMAGERADIIYVDPPWGQGNIRYWETLNYKHTGEKRPGVSLDALYTALFDMFINHGKNLFFLENGLRWNEFVREYCDKYRVKLIQTIPLKYRSGSRFLPHELHVISKHPMSLPRGYGDSVSNTHGMETLRRALTPYAKKDTLVLDPCCGVGLTARATVGFKGRFFGNELNRVRLKKTRAFLESIP